jgi:hypothetical protein
LSWLDLSNLSEEQIDQIVVGQANDASAWDEPVRVKRTTVMTEKDENDVRSEYDFSAGVRGKHHRAMQKGYTVTIHQTDGSMLLYGLSGCPLAPAAPTYSISLAP